MALCHVTCRQAYDLACASHPSLTGLHGGSDVCMPGIAALCRLALLLLRLSACRLPGVELPGLSFCRTWYKAFYARPHRTSSGLACGSCYVCVALLEWGLH